MTIHLQLVQRDQSQSRGRSRQPVLLANNERQRYVAIKKCQIPSAHLSQRYHGADNNLSGQCSGSNPCDQCSTRNSQCVYDLAADQRRKIANQRNIEELAQKGEDIERLCVVLGGILATIRAGNRETLDDLTHTIRNRGGLPDLSSYVNGLMATWPEIYLEFQKIDFYLDDAPRRPSVEMIEKMDKLSSTAAAGPIFEEEPDHTAQHQGVLLDESGAKRSVIEPYSSNQAMNTREHTHRPIIDANIDVRTQHSQHRHKGSDSASDGGSARSYRTARPWELP